MSDRHEKIKWDVIKNWTKDGRGRLYCMNQGLAFPARKNEIGETVPSQFPLWFGPLKRKFKGFPDVFGFEKVGITHLTEENDLICQILPIFTVVEVKTKNDTIKANQRRVINFLHSVGVRCYLAWEADNERGYNLVEWQN